jgi:uncharacterized membrane protein (UPF0136 family)
MPWLSAVSLLYGLLNLVFGILGFVIGGSVPSIIAGGVAGLAAIFGATLAKTHERIGYLIVTVISVLILGRFFKKAFLDQQIYPAMILALASIAMLACLTVGHFTAKKVTTVPEVPVEPSQH